MSEVIAFQRNGIPEGAGMAGLGDERWNICTRRRPTLGSSSVPSLAIFTSRFAFQGLRSPRVR